MPTLGSGILPAAGAVANELVAVTRRAFIPKVIVQIYKANPTTSALLSVAEPVSGGVSPVTIPVQGAAMVQTSTTDYSGSFTAPQVITGLQNAEFNLKAMVTPIPYYVFEGLVQMDAAVIPIVEARMNDAGNSISDYIGNKQWTASASVQDIWSIPDVINTSNPARGNFGGIDRTNTWWRGNLKTATALTGSAVITRNNVLASIVSATKQSGGEMPSFGVMGPGTWTALAQDFVGSERYINTPESAFSAAEEGARAAFTALSVAGVPIYMDLYCTESQLVLFNTSYIGYKIHSDAAFAVAGPESLLPQMQLGFIMVVVTVLELVCSKPAAQTMISGYTGALTGL